MAEIKDVLELTVLASGTLNVPVQRNLSIGSFEGSMVRIVGTTTLTGNLDISPSGTPVKNTVCTIIFEANVTTASSKVNVFGEPVPDEFFAAAGVSKFTVHCLYNGSAWNVRILADFDTAGIVGEDSLATDSVVTSKIKDLNVTTVKLADLGVTTAKIADANVTTAKIANLNVTTAKIADLGVTTDKIDDLGVTTAKIANDNVTTEKIADGNVTTAKIANANVTPAKMSDNANRYTRDIRISFLTAGEIGVLNFIMGEDCEIEQVSGTVIQPFATDTGTVIFKNHAGTVMTGSQIDFTTGLVLGNQVTNTVTGNNSFTRGQKVTLELSKTTAGSGIANISLLIKKV